MSRSFRRLPFQSRRPRGEAGVTLVELLVALLISSVVLPLIWISIRGAIQFTEATIWQVQLERDLDRLTTLLDAEAEDACLFGTTAAPVTCDVAVPACAADNQLQMRVTLLNANNVPSGNAVITYTLDGDTDRLLRTGPRILATGQLGQAAVDTDQLVMRGVTAFAVTPNDDCNTATIVVTAQPVAPNVFTPDQNFGNAVTRTFGVRTGSRPFVD